MIRAVTLDATRTLFEPRDLAGDYANVLERHRLGLGRDELRRLIPVVWQELGCAGDPAHDRFAAHPGGARGFWRHYLERLCELAGAPRPSPFAAAELFEHFATPAPWRRYDDVAPALEGLRARGLRLAVISNWDERLTRVLAALDLARFFDAVLVSAEVGVEKPHPRIFAVALARLDVAAHEAVHVGDHALEDVEGARGAGLHALRLARTLDHERDAGRGGGAEPGVLDSLAELAARLDSFA